MSLINNITAVSEQIRFERASSGGTSSPTGKAVQDQAEFAIRAGQGRPPGDITPEWRTYMERFARPAPDAPINPADLARLLPTDGSHTDVDLQKERAYLVANGTCGATTTDDLANGGVTVKLG